MGHSYMPRSFLFKKKKKKPPVYVANDAVITVKHILTERAGLVEVRKKYFEERSLYSLFRNVNPEKIIFNFLKEIGTLCRV